TTTHPPPSSCRPRSRRSPATSLSCAYPNRRRGSQNLAAVVTDGAALAQAVAIDRHRLDQGEDLAADCELAVARRAHGDPGPERHPDIELEIDMRAVADFYLGDGAGKHVQDADVGGASQCNGHVARPEAHANLGAERQIEVGDVERPAGK